MLVKDVMSFDARVARPDQTIREVARMMRDMDIGALPVGEDDRLVGMITDRDIAVRGVAEDRPVTTIVREVMSEDVRYCFDDEDAQHVAQNMREQQVRRLPVVNREKRLVGFLALSDLATQGGADIAGQALEGISQPGGQHNQTRP